MLQQVMFGSENWAIEQSMLATFDERFSEPEGLSRVFAASFQLDM